MKAWGILSPLMSKEPWIIPSSVRYSRGEAQKGIVETWGLDWTWKKLYRMGFRAVRVRIEEVRP